ncbi:hypothetical protein RB595_010143 [Gaeumannomyces hyphopodioides]
MLSEEFVSAICGPPLTSNTSIAKDVGVYVHTLSPAYSIKGTFKKNSAPPNCLAVNESHVFAAQDGKAALHVYSRLRGNQEAYVPFPEKIRCLALAGDVLVLGTAEGRIMLWEYCTGRLVSTPPYHVQAVTCLATTTHHVLSGSDDSNVHVWSLASLLALDPASEHEPERTLSNHRAAVVALAADQPAASSSPTSGGAGTTALCVSAARDKTCVVWDALTGQALRTLLLPAAPLCAALDPCARAVAVATDDGCLHLVELFGDPPLLGAHAPEAASTAVQVPASDPFGLAPLDAYGPASCLATSHDGTVLLSGHAKGKILQWSLAAEGGGGGGSSSSSSGPPVELADLNAAVSNVVFVPPLPRARPTSAPTVVKPGAANAAAVGYSFTAQLEGDLDGGRQGSRFDRLLATPGFGQDALEQAVLAFQQQQQQSAGSGGGGPSENEVNLQLQNEELLQIINEQRALYKQVLQKQAASES